MSNLNRYQIYLDPKAVSKIDELAKALEVSRTRIMRDTIERMARDYGKVINSAKKITWKKNPLLKMAGIIKGTKPGISENIDEIYLRD